MHIDSIISDMAQEVVDLCHPHSIYLVSYKNNSKGVLSGFKLCVVAADDILPQVLETKLLLSTDCEIPCDFIVYNLTDWNECAEDDCSFAYRVENGGVLLYEQGK
ncbi:MAG: hypothetical protein LIO69_08110 [Oscillospiraceae bacterium]|nr:hypothetical protein [Oscillospiraceae bacterium]